jgi:soluble lytic murein transglycosylase-like protein
LVRELAPQFGIDPNLALAIIRVESGFNPKAESPKRAKGLMQLLPETASRFQVEDIWDPEQNIRGGLRYLRWLLKRFEGQVHLAVAAYNAGEGAVERHAGIPPYRETQQYVRKVSALYPKSRHPLPERISKTDS